MLYRWFRIFLLTLTVYNSQVGSGATVTSPWFSGTPEEAFKASRERKVPVLLYWGAVWCPPCNELKSQVFSHPGFRPLVSQVVAVYLDGDTEEAQTWGEKLKASGYPTVLLLNSEGKEILRLGTSVTFEEFKVAFETALSLKSPVHELLDKVAKTGASDQIWQTLAFNSWEQLLSEDQKKNLPAILMGLFSKSPAKLKDVRAALAARTIQAFTDEEPGKIPAEGFPAIPDALFLNLETMKAARDTLIYRGEKILPAIQKSVSDDQFQAIFIKWEMALEVLAKAHDLSTDTRLWANYGKIRLFQVKNGKEAKLPATLVSYVKEAALNAEKEAKSSYERHAVISGVAYILRKIGDADTAASVLEKELATTDTPWYYQSSLASLEEDRGNVKKSLYWSAEARKSAQGKATRIQWIAGDLERTIRLSPENVSTVHDLVKQYYDLVLSLEDGFKGRNASRAEQVRKALDKMPPDADIRKTLSQYGSKCPKDDSACLSHFEKVAARPNPVKGS